LPLSYFLPTFETIKKIKEKEIEGQLRLTSPAELVSPTPTELQQKAIASRFVYELVAN
tara:strand:+ start:127 stop:300 length:174 start_codon:yes stop_codon:yes gene_type:complete